ncbi:MAG: hypothetical protein SFV53_06800 [Rickettsiales bacterium]|nr:hypothetical protein [Rickettsiales bacterium]
MASDFSKARQAGVKLTISNLADFKNKLKSLSNNKEFEKEIKMLEKLEKAANEKELLQQNKEQLDKEIQQQQKQQRQSDILEFFLQFDELKKAKEFANFLERNSGIKCEVSQSQDGKIKVIPHQEIPNKEIPSASPEKPSAWLVNDQQQSLIR